MVVTLQELTNFTISTAVDGLDGLSKCVEERPDCAVIDVKMPEIDGTQLVRALRGDPLTEHLPLVILTALVQDKDRFVGLISGADRYLTKPVEAEDLIHAIHEAITLSAADRNSRFQTLANEEGDANV
jgi:two-component system, cell cycle response regulator